MRKRILVVTAVLIGMLGVGLPVWGQQWEGMGPGFGGHRGGRMGARLLAMLDNDRFKANLGLTDQQAERLRQIVVDTEKSRVRVGADIAIRGIELRELLRADKPDRDAVMKKTQEISTLLGELIKQHVDALLTAKTVLTPEQQKKVRTLIESRMGGEMFGGMMREHRMERPGGPFMPPHGAPEPPQKPAEPPQPH